MSKKKDNKIQLTYIQFENLFGKIGEIIDRAEEVEDDIYISIWQENGKIKYEVSYTFVHRDVNVEKGEI